MLEWIRKTFQKKAPQIPGTLEQLLRDMSVATAVAEIISEYLEKSLPPAYTRKLSFAEAWGYTRLDALSHLWRHGASDGAILADAKYQNELFVVFFNDRPHLKYPLVNSCEPVHDTLQAIIMLYDFLGKAGTTVGSRETSDIFNNFEKEMVKAREQLNSTGSAPTVFRILYKDVTQKSKSIALASVFGPDYLSNIQALISHAAASMRESKHSQEEIKAKVASIESNMKMALSANDPDELISAT